MSDVEKAIAAANKYDTSGVPHTAVAALQQRPQQQQQQQYYIKPTITANTHYCHETGHIKTAPLTTTTASATLPRRGHHASSVYTHTKATPAGRSSSPPCSTASGASTSSSASADSGCPSLGQHNCLSLILKLIFSTPGLVVLVVAYSIMGAFIFPLLEAPQDLTKSAAIAKSREDCLRELWIITEKLNVLYERNWTMLVHEQLRRFEGSIVAATRHGGNAVASAGGRGSYAGRQDNAAGGTAVGRFGGGQFDGLEDVSRWSFSEALLYSVTVITTIGHGSLTPKTAAGKIATILYALIGVPLMLMCLSSLGSLLAEALQCTYARICCRLSATTTTTTTRATDSTTSKTATTKATEKKPILRKGSKRQRRYDSDADDVRAEKKLQHAENAAVESSGGECHEKLHTVESRGCKYDALPNIAYTDYNAVNNATLGGHNEESCHLLQHQSPIRANQHNVGCMQQLQQQHQAQYYQQQQQQQQQQQHQTASGQQRPDVMLMAHQPQHYNRSATPSPQHTYQHPYQLQQQYQITASTPPTQQPTTTTTTPTPSTMQTFHLVTSTGSTANAPPPPSSSSSSPTQAATTSSPAVSQLAYTTPPPRHFVAVPSGLIRFPPNTNTNTNNSAAAATTTVNALTLDGAGPATTTIYFPLSSSGGGAVISGNPATQVAFMAAASSGVAPTTATLAVAGSPFVKYHTIQFQPKKPYIVAANNEGDGGSMCPLVPLPPPPAYQTATVHGVRRAKFLTKPLPQEINNLLAENDIDISCRHDLAQSSCTSPITPATAGVSQSGGAVASSTLGASTTTVDIMEDEEENEQDRMGCPHGTPSRIPLISSVSSASPYDGHNDYTEATEKLKQRSGGGLINATAASFHRHTFQRKAASSQRRQPPKGHADNRRRRRQHAKRRHSCYGDPVETTTDDDNDDNDMAVEYQHRRGMANEQFVLTQIYSHGRVTGTSTELDDKDNDDDDFDDDGAGDMEHTGPDLGNGGRHVPIILVLGILICYICLGTVIFAFWENWSLIDGAYFCFVTLATIGYGDFLPERTFNGPEVQLFACCAYLLLGLVLVAMSFSILETQLLWKCKRIAVRLKLATD